MTRMSAAEYREAAKPAKRRSKYGAERTIIDGISFDSKAEAQRFQVLRALESGGAICDIELQPKYPITLNGVHICNVILDFRYFDRIDGRTVIEDVKGRDTPISKLKRKMVEAQHGITVEIVR